MGKSKCLRKSHWKSEETGASVLWGEAEGGRIALAPEEKAQGEFIDMCKYLMGRTWWQFLPSDIQRQDKRQWAQTDTQEILLKYKEKFYFPCEGNWTWEQVAWRSYKVSVIRDTQTAAGQFEATCSSWSCFEGRVRLESLQRPTQASAILWLEVTSALHWQTLLQSHNTWKKNSRRWNLVRRIILRWRHNHFS